MPRVLLTDTVKAPIDTFTNGYGPVITLAGGTNITPDPTVHHIQLSAEQLLALNPQALMFDDYAQATAAQFQSYFTTTFPTIDAVKNMRFLSIKDIQLNPGIAMIYSVQTVAKFLYPNAF